MRWTEQVVRAKGRLITMRLLEILAIGVLALAPACKIHELTPEQFASLEATLSADAQDVCYVAVKKKPKLADTLLVFAAAIVRVDPSKSEDYAKALEEASIEDAVLRIALRHAVTELQIVGSQRSQELAKAIASGIVAGVELAKPKP